MQFCDLSSVLHTEVVKPISTDVDIYVELCKYIVFMEWLMLTVRNAHAYPAITSCGVYNDYETIHFNKMKNYLILCFINML